MGVMLSVLCSYMGAIELLFIVRDLTHQLALHQMRLRNEDPQQSDISVLQGKIRASIDALETVDLESVEQMQDGVLYKNGYRIENEQSVELVAQQWDERRKVMCVPEVSTTESQLPSTVSNGYAGNGMQNERTRNVNEYAGNSSASLNDDEPNEPNNYRPIVRDDRTGRRKAFKKRHSSSSQSGDSIRLSREEELQMFTSLEEEEHKNSSFTPISYSNDTLVNSPKNIDSSFHEKQKYDAEAWRNKKPSNYHDSELWKRERATSIVEEKEDNSFNSKPTTSDKKPRALGTADKSTRKTPCENDKYASDRNACELLDKVDENADSRPLELMEPTHTIKKIENLPNLNQYFNDALETDVEHTRTYNTIASPPIVIDKPFDDHLFVERDATELRDARSSTVYSRSDSESSNIYHKSLSSDSSSTYNDNRRSYNRTDSSSSFIQDELDSEEYHHNHRFSLTADTLEYIRGRDDWRVYTENKSNNLYRRQSSNISIREEIDSDEYHHDRKLTDLIEIAYLDSEIIKSLPSSFEDNKVFDRYYLELQQINGQLSKDIERNIAQKQVILLDSNQIETAEGYLYPLPDIILDQASEQDHENNHSYTIEELDSDYSNISESEDDVQSVIEVHHGSTYEGEIITTLDMDGDMDEMIEVTLWDLKNDRELSSKESSVEIISIPNECPIDDKDLVEQSYELLVLSDEESNSTGILSNTSGVTATNDTLSSQTLNALERSEDRETNDLNIESVNLKTLEDTSEKDIGDVKNSKKSESYSASHSFSETNKIEESLVRSKSPAPIRIEDELLRTIQQNAVHPTSTLIDTTKSFIERENLSSAQQTGASNSSTTTTETTKESEKSKKLKKGTSYDNVDDLIKEGCMGVWFHK